MILVVTVKPNASREIDLVHLQRSLCNKVTLLSGGVVEAQSASGELFGLAYREL